MHTRHKKTLELCFVGRYNAGELFTGPEKVARRISDEMAILGHHVYFYEYFFSGKSFGYMKKLFGNDIIESSAGRSVFRVGIFPFLFAILRRRFDVIHIITFERFAILVFLLKPFINAPIIYTIHDTIKHRETVFGSTAKRSLKIKGHISEFLFFKFSDILFFFSDQSVSIASQYYKIPKEKVVIVANGIDDIFRELKKREKKGRADVAVVFVGDSKRPEKGFDFFLRALERCSRRADVFVICETAPSRVDEDSKGHVIRFINKMQTRDYAAFLSNKDIYVSGSSFDPFPIAAVEAMSAGLAPVVSKETGMSRYIEQGVNGFVVPYGDVQQLAQILTLLIADDKLRKKISSNARSSVSMLSWRAIAEDYLKKYAIE